MSLGDFHLHTVHSDGRKTPAEVAAMAYRNGVRYLALTDHDTVAGMDEMRAAVALYPGLTLIPGVELSVEAAGTEIHMLGYWFDERDPTFLAQLEQFREGRIGRGREMVERLRALGMTVAWERVLEIAGEASVGRPHVALALLEKGYVGSVNEAFDRYLGNGKPAYVAREKLLPADAIGMIEAAGGIAVVAHPQFIEDRDARLTELAGLGVVGMEVYYKANPPELIAELAAVAERLGVLPLGGSDYHGLERTRGDEEVEPGQNPMPDEAVRPFLALGRGRPGWTETAAAQRDAEGAAGGEIE